MEKPTLWTKDFFIVSLTNFGLYFTFYLLFATITEYASVDLGANTSEAGLVAGVFVIGMLFSRLFAGKYVDIFGPKKLLFIGLGLTIITTLFYFAAVDVTTLYIVRLLHGATLGIGVTATGAIIARIIPPERHGEGIGYYALSIPLGGSNWSTARNDCDAIRFV